ncbi:hypothetical protein SVAN01_04308 [Stagonosporopsis vannaccii]|nr:hypothetical protein SVAN01_04308 [Stagonosporopsis vannaccii]
MGPAATPLPHSASLQATRGGSHTQRVAARAGRCRERATGADATLTQTPTPTQTQTQTQAWDKSARRSAAAARWAQRASTQGLAPPAGSACRLARASSPRQRWFEAHGRRPAKPAQEVKSLGAPTRRRPAVPSGLCECSLRPQVCSCLPPPSSTAVSRTAPSLLHPPHHCLPAARCLCLCLCLCFCHCHCLGLCLSLRPPPAPRPPSMSLDRHALQLTTTPPVHPPLLCTAAHAGTARPALLPCPARLRLASRPPLRA